jgi:hypothetical protein
MTRLHTVIPILVIGLMTLSFIAKAADETASYAFEPTVKLSSDVRNRATSDSLSQPGVRLNLHLAHESGMTGFVELASVSTKQFLNGSGLSAVVGAGWRTGDPDAWHFGLGAAAELFPGASFDAPNSFDTNTGIPGDVRNTKYDSTFAVLEAGYGALEFRALSVLSDTYRGINTGGVCGTLLMLNPDPMVGINCYSRGDQNSHGTWLFDLDYKYPLNPQTTLNLHAGFQRVKNFPEADVDDYAIGITHKRWGFEFTGEWLIAQTKARELYLVPDGNQLVVTDNNKLVFTVSRKF